MYLQKSTLIFPVLFFGFLGFITPSTQHKIPSTQYYSSCSFEETGMPQYPSMYEHNGQEVPSYVRRFILVNSNISDVCMVNTTTLIESYEFPKDTVVAGIFAFGCTLPVKLIFSETGLLKNAFYNVIGYFQVQGCSLDMESVQQFSDIVDVRVVTMYNVLGLSYSDSYGNGNWTRGLLGNAVALSLGGITSEDKPDLSLLDSKATFPNMKEISLYNMGLSKLPMVIREKFPYLESLEMPNNNLTLPPSEFPWSDMSSDLPRNLSRSLWFQSHYSEYVHIDIQPYVYRRVFNLENNKIRNLTEFQFHGHLHMITLSDNGLEDIDGTCFRFVTNLQHIGLGNNRLASLPDKLLKGLQYLRHFDAQNNLLTEIPNGIFDDLVNLVYLNLASNRISFLRKNLFTKLLHLKELILDGNKLTEIHLSSFPLQSVALEYVSFNNNPLQEIPLLAFYVRSLEKIDLRNTTISMRTLTGLMNKIDLTLLGESVIYSASDSTIDIFRRPSKLRTIDLSGSNVSGVFIEHGINRECSVKLLIVMIHFHFKLDNNPLICDCQIVPLINFVRRYVENGTLSRNDYFFKEWICTHPNEFSGRQIFDVKEEETYCKSNVSSCPDRCNCYERTKSRIIIVDCRGVQLEVLPFDLPEGILDLWFQNNNITRIESRNYLNRVRSLYVSQNQIAAVSSQAVREFTVLETFDLSSNHLLSLPKEVEYLSLKELTINDNPFSCDCHSLWLRSWVERNKDIVRDVPGVTCNTQIGTARPLLQVPSSEFVCKEDFDTKKHVLIPATVSSVSVVLVMLLVVVIYIYRLEVKVFLYVYLGVRPFDKANKLESKSIDLVIVHSHKTQNWVTENAISLTGRTNLSDTCFIDICKDLIAGFTFQENIACLVEETRKILFVLSKDFLADEKLRMAWNETKNKIPRNGVDFIQFVTDGISDKDVLDSSMAKVMRHTRFLSTKEKFIKQKVMYMIPPVKSTDRNRTRLRLQTMLESRNAASQQSSRPSSSNIFLTYSEDSLSFVISKLNPQLIEAGYTVYLPDRDFVLGAAKEENILDAVSLGQHTLFLISEKLFEDEWSLFTFRAAVQKSLREKYNHLIVVSKGDINICTVQDEELRHYLKSHVTLQIEDDNFFVNLTRSLRQSDKSSSGMLLQELSVKGLELNSSAKGQVKVNDIHLHETV